MDINKLAPLLDKNNIESSTNNCYLFLLFFLQKAQLISNIIRLINKDCNDSLTIAVKYSLMHNINYEKIGKRMKDFRKDFEKGDLINEILNFIKQSLDNPSFSKKMDDMSVVKINEDAVRPLYFKTKLESLLLTFTTLDKMIDEIESSLILNELDLSTAIVDRSGIHDSYYERNLVKLNRDITKIELDWLKYKKQKKPKNKEMYNIVKNWLAL